MGEPPVRVQSSNSSRQFVPAERHYTDYSFAASHLKNTNKYTVLPDNAISLSLSPSPHKERERKNAEDLHTLFARISVETQIF